MTRIDGWRATGGLLLPLNMNEIERDSSRGWVVVHCDFWWLA
jgi:hypothetical protein